jgi:hypothetical protein
MYDSAKQNMQRGAITFRYSENCGVFLLQSWQLNGEIFDSTDDEAFIATLAWFACIVLLVVAVVATVFGVEL